MRINPKFHFLRTSLARNLATPIGKRVPINTPEANSGTVSTISLAHYKKNVKPINSEFIALIADKLQLQLKSSEVANFWLGRNAFSAFLFWVANAMKMWLIGLNFGFHADELFSLYQWILLIYWVDFTPMNRSIFCMKNLDFEWLTDEFMLYRRTSQLREKHDVRWYPVTQHQQIFLHSSYGHGIIIFNIKFTHFHTITLLYMKNGIFQ